jgi:hypothetical protein
MKSLKKDLKMKIELDFQSPYNPDGTPRTDLPTGEVLAGNGTDWIVGKLKPSIFIDGKLDCIEGDSAMTLINVLRFAPLPEKIEE